MIGPPPSSLLAAADRKPPIYRLLGLRRLRVAVHHETLLPALVEHVGLVLQVVDEPEAVGLPGGLLVHCQELLLRQQGAQLLQHRLQLQLVPEPPDADELHVDADALMSLSFWDETQVLICMWRPRMNSVSKAPSPVLRCNSGWSAKSSTTIKTWNSFLSPSCLLVLVIFLYSSMMVRSAPSSYLSK